ncbi:MAG: alpha/beta hydrolase [Bdellovibrionales bacterium]
MRRLNFICILAGFVGLAGAGIETVNAAAFTRGFVEIRADQRLYVEQRPAQNGSPTLVLINGLTYSTREWTPLVQALDAVNPDLGLVLYDMEGMGQTLLDKAPVRFDIPLGNQTRDLNDLLQALDLQGRSVLVGLSYGGAVALQLMHLYPDAVQKAVVIAPFLERLPEQDAWIQSAVRQHQLWYPLDPRNEDELYDFYLRILVYTTFPLKEPIILENRFKAEAIFRMVKGAKDWNAIEIARSLPAEKLHVIAAEQDEHVRLDRMNLFWSSLSPSARQSYLIVQGSRHKIPETEPRFLAHWLGLIASGREELSRGLTFIGYPRKGRAECRNLLLPVDRTKGNDPESSPL